VPTPKAQEQFLFVLQGAKNRLEYLSPDDWTLIIDRAKQLSFKKNEILVQQGKQSKMIYVIASGKVNVTVSGMRLAQVGAGQVCGEMSFLENAPASATATAEEEVEAFALDWQTLMDLFELFPHLASRFYRSLAVSLSRRLREQIMAKH
jgi:CRP/FNR family cyclic AMP-dependent transcriptional regulator